MNEDQIGDFLPWGYSVTTGTVNTSASYHYQFNAATKPYLFTQVTSGYSTPEINWITMTATLDFTQGLAPHVLQYIELRSNYSAQGESYFHYPTCIASDLTGNIYVGSWMDGCIWKLDSSGNLLGSIGSKGTGYGQFQKVTGIAVNSTGYIYTLDNVRNLIQVFDPNGYYVYYTGFEGMPARLQSVFGPCNVRMLALDSNGFPYITVYIPGSSQSVILEYNRIGSGYEEDSSGLINAVELYGIAINSTNYVYMGDRANNKIRIYSNTLDYKRQFTANYPLGIEFNASDYLYVATNAFTNASIIDIYNPWGTKIGYFGSGYYNFYDVLPVSNNYVVDCGTNTTFVFSKSYQEIYIKQIGYEFCNAYLVLKYNGGSSATVLDGLQGAIGSRGMLNQTFAISAYPNPTALEIIIETKYSWVQYTKSSQYCIDYLRIYGTVIDLENLTIIDPLAYSVPDKTFTCDIHNPVIFSIDTADYSGWNLYLAIKPISGTIIKYFHMTEHWITEQSYIFSYTFAVASTYVFLVQANDTNGFSVFSEVFNVIAFDNPYPKKASLHYYAPDGFGLDPELFKTYIGTDEATEIDYFYNQTHLNWHRLYLTSNVNITYDPQGMHVNMSRNGVQATCESIVINASSLTYPFYSADTIVFDCASPDAHSLILILGGYSPSSNYYAHAKDYNITLSPGRNTYQIPISMFTTFDDIWLMTLFGFYGTGNFTIFKIAASILFETTFYPNSSVVVCGNNETKLVLTAPASDYCSFLIIGNSTPAVWVYVVEFKGNTTLFLWNYTTTGTLKVIQITTRGYENISIVAAFPAADTVLEIDQLTFFNETGYHLQSDANRVIPPAIEFSRGWETILVTDYYGQQLFRNYTTWTSFIDIEIYFFIQLIYNPEDYPVVFIISRGTINIMYIVPPLTYIEIRIAASIYDVTVTDTHNALIMFFTISLDGFHKTVITFKKYVPITGTGPRTFWEWIVYLFTGPFAFFMWLMIVILIYAVYKAHGRSKRSNDVTLTAHELAIYRIGLHDGEQRLKYSKEQITRRIKNIHVG